MDPQHISHIISTCSTIRQHLDEIRQVVTAGTSPAGNPLTPMPEPRRGRLLHALQCLSESVDRLAGAFEPGEGKRSATGELGATDMWVSILLRTVLELVEDLRPERVSRRYGALGTSDSARLGAALGSVIESLHEALEAAGSET